MLKLPAIILWKISYSTLDGIPITFLNKIARTTNYDGDV